MTREKAIRYALVPLVAVLVVVASTLSLFAIWMAKLSDLIIKGVRDGSDALSAIAAREAKKEQRG